MFFSLRRWLSESRASSTETSRRGCTAHVWAVEVWAGTTIRAATAHGALPTKRVETVDKMEHGVEVDSIVLLVGARGGGDGAREGRLILQYSVEL